MSNKIDIKIEQVYKYYIWLVHTNQHSFWPQKLFIKTGYYVLIRKVEISQFIAINSLILRSFSMMDAVVFAI
jgi:uncharacterized protein YbdZ (MbtH family)